MNTPILYIIMALIVGVFFPIYVIIEGPKVKQYLTQNPDKLNTIYTQVLVQQVILVLLIFAAFYFNGDSIDLIGLTFIKNPMNIAGLLSISSLFFVIMHSIRFSKESLEKIKVQYAKISYLIPKNNEEYRYAIALSFGVGIFEEIIYRGFLYWQISLYLPFAAALILTNVIFGLLHIGTGRENALSTFILGMIYSGLSIYFDSLWIAILAHILTDLYSICIGYKLKELKET